MIRFEIRKHLRRFTVIFISSMLILNLVTVFVQYASYLTPQSHQIRDIKINLLNEYNTDKDQFYKEYNEYLDRKKELESLRQKALFSDADESSVSSINQIINLPNYGDRQLYSEIMVIIDQSENYKNDINELLYESYSKIKEIGIQKGAYGYEYQVGIITHYEKLLDIEITPEYQYGWSDFFTLKTPVIFLAITYLGVFTGIFTIEKKAKIINILHICKNGGKRLNAVKICVVVIISVLLTLLFTLLPLIVLSLTTGLSNVSQYIHAVDGFAYCPYGLTIWQYLIIFVAVKVLLFLALAILISVLGQLSGNDVFVLGVMFVFLVLNSFLFSLGNSSPLFIIKKFNFFELAFVNLMFNRYRALKIFSRHVNLIGFIILLISFTCIILVIISLIVKISDKESQSEKIIKKILLLRKATNIEHGKSLITYEFHKNILNRRNITIICIFIMAKIAISAIYYTPIQTNEEQIYKNYIADLYGEINEQKAEYVDEEQLYINTSISEYEAAQESYKKGEIGLDALRDSGYRYNYASSVFTSFQRITDKFSYLQKVNGDYDNILFIYEYGVKIFLFLPFDIVLVLFIVTFFSNIFAIEYHNRFSTIMRLAKYGRNRTFYNKYRVCVVSVIVMCIMFSAVDLAFLFGNYGTNYLKAGIMSISEYSTLCMNISILQYILLYKIASLIGFMLFALIAASMSVIMGHAVKTSIILLFLIIVPFLLDYFNINYLHFVNITCVINPTYVNEYGLQYIIYSIIVIILFVIAKRKWIGRKF